MLAVNREGLKDTSVGLGVLTRCSRVVVVSTDSASVSAALLCRAVEKVTSRALASIVIPTVVMDRVWSVSVQSAAVLLMIILGVKEGAAVDVGCFEGRFLGGVPRGNGLGTRPDTGGHLATDKQMGFAFSTSLVPSWAGMFSISSLRVGSKMELICLVTAEGGPATSVDVNKGFATTPRMLVLRLSGEDRIGEATCFQFTPAALASGSRWTLASNSPRDDSTSTSSVSMHGP